MRKGSIHMTNEKVHYKMYKDGRTWVFAAITVATLGLGIVTGTGVTAHADNTDTGVTATGATDTTSGTTATLGGSSSSADNSGTVDNTATQPITPAEVPVDSTTSTDPTAATTTATPTSAPVAAPQAADTPTTPNYVGNAQSQPAIIDRNSGEATKSTDGTVATEAGSNGVTVGAYWTAENGDGDVTQSISSDGNDKSYSTVSASAQNIQSHFTFGNTSTTDITTGAVYLITPYADYTSDIADGKIDPHFETNMTAAEVVASLPTGFTATFSQKGGQYNIAADQLTDDQVATLVAVELKGTIAAGQTYDVTWNQNLIAAGTDGRYADTHTLYLSPNGLIQPDASAYADVATQTMPAADGTVTIGTTFGNSKVSSDATQTSDGVNDIPVNGFAYFDVTVEDPNTITAGFSLANNTDDYNATNVFFMLPKLYSPNYNNATNLFTVDATQVNESTFTDAFPSDVSIMYSVESGKYLSMSDMLAQHPDFTWDQLLAFQVRGTLAAQTSYQINLPLDYINQDKTDLISTDVNAATGAFAFNGVGDYTGDIQSNLSLTMPYGLQLDGPYSPIYVNADGSYTLVGSDLFNLMPQIDKADVLVSNNGNYFDGTAADTTLYYGGFFYLKLAKLQAILAQNGYTVELNADGTPMDGYMFDTLNGPAVVHDSTDGTVKVIAGGTNSGGIFAVIKVLNTHDSTVQATKDTTIKLTDNLDGVGPSNYYTVGASDVTATLSDPDGVLKDNGDGTYSVTKPGQYTVTYSLAISGAVTVTKQATVTVDPKITYGTYTTTRTINFVNEDGTPNTNTPVTQTATYKTTTNQLTGETVYTVQNAYYEAQVPVEAGYEADTDTIAQQALGATNVMPADSTITVNYQPTYTYGSATSTRTINFVNSDGTTASIAPIVQTITYKTATKDATGETVYTPAGAYYEVSVPTQTNYTPQQATVAQQAVGASIAAPTNTTLTVTYDPTSTYGTATSTRTINFVNADGTTNSQAPVVQTITYKTVTNAVTGETIYTPQGAYYEYHVSPQAGYVADQKVIAQEAVGATNMAPTNSTVTVTYTPTYTYGTTTSTRTINFVNTDGTDNGISPVVQTITYKTVTSDATGETVYTPQDAYYEVQVPTQTGYTANQTTVVQAAVGALATTPENTTVTVTYTKNATTDPGDGGSTTDPDNGGSTTNPDNGGTTTPDNGGSTTTSPDNSGTATTPGNNSTNTGAVSDTTTTTSGESSTIITPETDSTTADGSGKVLVVTNDGTQPTHVDEQFAKGVTPVSSESTITDQTDSDKQPSTTAAHLPQTNETESQSTTVIGLSLLGLMSLFGLARKPRRKE